jgi:hypothetical protein
VAHLIILLFSPDADNCKYQSFIASDSIDFLLEGVETLIDFGI